MNITLQDLVLLPLLPFSKQEIARLYAQAGSTMIGSATIPQPGALRLSDVFKMDASELATKRIGYTNLVSKQ